MRNTSRGAQSCTTSRPDSFLTGAAEQLLLLAGVLASAGISATCAAEMDGAVCQASSTGCSNGAGSACSTPTMRTSCMSDIDADQPERQLAAYALRRNDLGAPGVEKLDDADGLLTHRPECEFEYMLDGPRILQRMHRYQTGHVAAHRREAASTRGPTAAAVHRCRLLGRCQGMWAGSPGLAWARRSAVCRAATDAHGLRRLRPACNC